MQVAALTLWLALLAALFVPLERLFAVSRAPRTQTAVDIIWYFINSIVPALVLAAPLAIIAAATQRIVPLESYYIAIGALPLWAKLLLALALNDFGSYWMHRLSHASPFLWRFHAVHHSPEKLDWLVNTRAHPLDMIVTRFGGLLLVYVSGLAQVTDSGLDPLLLAVTFGGTLWSFLIHANIRWRLGPLEWLVSTPAFHHWHHTNDEHRDRNFAAIFPLYDRLFGTLHLPAGFPPVYGIDGHVAPTFTAQLVGPLAAPLREPGKARG